MKTNWKCLITIGGTLFICGRVLAGAEPPASSWDQWRPLVGQWQAAGKGSPGEGAGGFSFAFDLQNKVLVRKSHTIVSLFALLGFTYLLLCIVCVTVLLRYRRAIPLMFALLLADYLSRRVILHFLPVGRVGAPPGVMVNLALFMLMIVGFALSLWPEKKT